MGRPAFKIQHAKSNHMPYDPALVIRCRMPGEVLCPPRELKIQLHASSAIIWLPRDSTCSLTQAVLYTRGDRRKDDGGGETTGTERPQSMPEFRDYTPSSGFLVIYNKNLRFSRFAYFSLSEDQLLVLRRSTKLSPVASADRDHLHNTNRVL